MYGFAVIAFAIVKALPHLVGGSKQILTPLGWWNLFCQCNATRWSMQDNSICTISCHPPRTPPWSMLHWLWAAILYLQTFFPFARGIQQAQSNVDHGGEGGRNCKGLIHHLHFLFFIGKINSINRTLVKVISHTQAIYFLTPARYAQLISQAGCEATAHCVWIHSVCCQITMDTQWTLNGHYNGHYNGHCEFTHRTCSRVKKTYNIRNPF